jgi:hypothetical protein
MPNSTCLHVRERESGPIRVVEIPWVSVRIGRASYCEVRLADVDLPPEVCRLRRRGGSWQLVPLAAKTWVQVDGRPVESPCPVLYGAPFFVGRYSLTLRRDRSAEPDWELTEAPVSRPLDCSYVGVMREDTTAVTSSSPWEAIPLPRQLPPPVAVPPDPAPAGGAAQTGTSGRSMPSFGNDWEARWRAAGAQIKAGTRRRSSDAQSARSGYDAAFHSVPLKEIRAPRPSPVAPGKNASPSSQPARPAPPVALGSYPHWVRAAQPPAASASSWTNWFAKERSRSEPWATGNEALAILEGETPDLAPLDSDEHIEEAELRIPAGDTPAAPDRERASVTQDEAISPLLAVQDISDGETSGHWQVSSPPAVPASAEPEPEPFPPAQRRTPADPDRRANETRTATLFLRDPHRAAAAPEMATARPVRSPDRDEWPSAQEILAMHREIAPRPRGPAAAVRRPRNNSSPTPSRAPKHWTLPAWLAGPPLALLIFALGAAEFALSWSWACDSYSASVLAERLMTASPSARRKPLPEWVAPPQGRWFFSTAQHLAHWAIFVSRLDAPEKERLSVDTRSLLSRALEASPINATARLAGAQLEEHGAEDSSGVRDLGLSRDALSLVFSAGRLAARGKQRAALELYRRALLIASHTTLAHGEMPRFNDDPSAPRYLLPGEERVREILRDLLSRTEWSFREWSEILPQNTTVPLVAARLLREQGRSDSEALLDLVVNQEEPLETGEVSGPLLLAARAEACAMRSRWREAEMQYRQAIELVEDETTKRSWWFNLAEVASRLDDEAQQQAALRAALAGPSSDEIARRATELRRGAGQRSRLRLGGARAN